MKLEKIHLIMILVWISTFFISIFIFWNNEKKEIQKENKNFSWNLENKNNFSNIKFENERERKINEKLENIPSENKILLNLNCKRIYTFVDYDWNQTSFEIKTLEENCKEDLKPKIINSGDYQDKSQENFSLNLKSKIKAELYFPSNFLMPPCNVESNIRNKKISKESFDVNINLEKTVCMYEENNTLTAEVKFKWKWNIEWFTLYIHNFDEKQIDNVFEEITQIFERWFQVLNLPKLDISTINWSKKELSEAEFDYSGSEIILKKENQSYKIKTWFPKLENEESFDSEAICFYYDWFGNCEVQKIEKWFIFWKAIVWTEKNWWSSTTTTFYKTDLKTNKSEKIDQKYETHCEEIDEFSKNC